MCFHGQTSASIPLLKAVAEHDRARAASAGRAPGGGPAKIEVLVGMIGSGKSTFARRRAREGALVISHDWLTEMLHAEYRYEPGLRDCYRQMEDALARWALVWGRDVVVDRTHLTRESRRRWLDLAAILATPAVAVFAVAFPIDEPDVHARRRFESDPRGRSFQIWLDVATHHYAQAVLEPLSPAEGFAAILNPEVGR